MSIITYPLADNYPIISTGGTYTWDIARESRKSWVAKREREVRDYSTHVEIRAGKSEATASFDGIASVVDTPYTVYDMWGEFTETIMEGAFKKTLRENDNVRLLVNHDGVPLASIKGGTLSLSAEPDLRAIAELDMANPTVQEIRSAMARGDMDQMSIGFQVLRQEWNGDYTERYIKEVKLFDVSVVTFPANPATSASIRSLSSFLQAVKFDDCDPAELRRAIAYLETLLPKEEEERDNSFDEAYISMLAEWHSHRK